MVSVMSLPCINYTWTIVFMHALLVYPFLKLELISYTKGKRNSSLMLLPAANGLCSRNSVQVTMFICVQRRTTTVD